MQTIQYKDRFKPHAFHATSIFWKLKEDPDAAILGKCSLSSPDQNKKSSRNGDD